MALGLIIGQLPFWGLLLYMLHSRRTDAGLTRAGFRTLKEQVPTARQAELLAGQQENQVAQAKRPEFPGDGYRPQSLSRTG